MKKQWTFCAIVMGIVSIYAGQISKSQNPQDQQFLRVTTGKKLEKLQNLLAKGANIEARDTYGRTALMRAMDFNNLEFVKFLMLQKNASVMSVDWEGKTALDRLHRNPAMMADPEIKKYLRDLKTNYAQQVKDAMQDNSGVDTLITDYLL